MKAFFFLLVLTILMAPVLAYCTEAVEPAPTIRITGEGGLLDKVTNLLFTILISVFVIFVLVAAFFFISAQGEPEKIKIAKSFLLYAIIGLIVGFCAKGFVTLVRVLVGGSSGVGGGDGGIII